MKVELLIHIMTLCLMIGLSSMLHNPRTSFYWETAMPITESFHGYLAPELLLKYPHAPSIFVMNFINFFLALLLLRVFLYELLNMWSAATFKQWSSTVWSWVSSDDMEMLFAHEKRKTNAYTDEWVRGNGMAVYLQVDLLTVVFYVLTVFIKDMAWTSRAGAGLTLLAWSKLLYFLKARSKLLIRFYSTGKRGLS